MEQPPLQIYEGDVECNEENNSSGATPSPHNNYEDVTEKDFNECNKFYPNGRTRHSSKDAKNKTLSCDSGESDFKCTNSQHRKVMIQGRDRNNVFSDDYINNGCASDFNEQFSQNDFYRTSSSDKVLLNHSNLKLTNNDSNNSHNLNNMKNCLYNENLGCDKDKKRKHRSEKEKRKSDKVKDRTKDKDDKHTKKFKIKISPPYYKNEDRIGGLKLTLKKQEGSSGYYRVGEEQRYHIEREEKQAYDCSFTDEDEDNRKLDFSDGSSSPSDMKQSKLVLQDVLKDKPQNPDDNDSNKRLKKQQISLSNKKRKIESRENNHYRISSGNHLYATNTVSNCENNSWHYNSEWYINSSTANNTMSYNNHPLTYDTAANFNKDSSLQYKFSSHSLGHSSSNQHQ